LPWLLKKYIFILYDSELTFLIFTDLQKGNGLMIVLKRVETLLAGKLIG